MKDNQNNFIYTDAGTIAKKLSEKVKFAKYYCVRNALRGLTEMRLQSSSHMPLWLQKARWVVRELGVLP